jgi:hypothetical protein|tara:strand:- start:156 stop:320 length:165 start_codon:yes stop_codon:yes gene_type:complete
MTFRKNQQPKFLSEGAVKEIVEVSLRKAISQQARELEKHLVDIDKRLRELEKNR